MNAETLLLVIVVILVVGSLPSWPYSRSWGYVPASILTLLLIGYLVWAISGGRPLFKSSGKDIKATVQDAGQDIKAAGRDMADSVRRAVE